MRSLFTPERSRPATLGAAFFSAGVLASLLSAPHHAHAAAACSATVYDAPSDITGVVYTMHAPVGTSVVSVVYPPDPNNIPQTFQFHADNPAGTWDSYTYVDTKTAGIGVTATAEVANLAVFATNGADHQQVRVHVGPSGSGGQGGQGGGKNGGDNNNN